MSTPSTWVHSEDIFLVAGTYCRVRGPFSSVGDHDVDRVGLVVGLYRTCFLKTTLSKP